MGHVPKYGKGKQKTNRRQLGQIAPPESPNKSLRTRHGSKVGGTSIKGVARTVRLWLKPRAEAQITGAQSMVRSDPEASEHRMSRQAMAVPSRPKVKPHERQ